MLEHPLGSDWACWGCPAQALWRSLIGARQQGVLGGAEPCLLIGSRWWCQGKGRGSARPQLVLAEQEEAASPEPPVCAPRAGSSTASPLSSQTRERRNESEVVITSSNDPSSTEWRIPGVPRSPPPHAETPPPLREPPGSGQPFSVGMNVVVGGPQRRPPDPSEGLQASGRAGTKGGG